MQRIAITIILLLGSLAPMMAQRFVYDVDALFFFDNREYHTPFDSSQSLLGARLSPEFGVLFRDSLQGAHRLMVGAQYVQPLNGAFKDITLIPTLYYHYHTPHLHFLMGSFPMHYMKKALPDVLFDDSLSYFYPNLRGALLRYDGKLGFLEASCDWYSMKTPEHPYEAFRLIVNGEIGAKCFFAGGYLTSTHYTQPVAHHRKIRVTDNLIAYPYVGMNVTPYVPLDSLSLQVGYLYTLSRDRFQQDMYVGHAAMMDFYVKKSFLKKHAVGLKNTFFWSDNFMPMYYRFGVDLYRGNPNFRAKMYNRTELFADIVKFDFVDLRFSWVFHFIYGWNVGHQQLVTVNFHLGELPKVKNHNTK